MFAVLTETHCTPLGCSRPRALHNLQTFHHYVVAVRLCLTAGAHSIFSFSRRLRRSPRGGRSLSKPYCLDYDTPVIHSHNDTLVVVRGGLGIMRRWADFFFMWIRQGSGHTLRALPFRPERVGSSRQSARCEDRVKRLYRWRSEAPPSVFKNCRRPTIIHCTCTIKSIRLLRRILIVAHQTSPRAGECAMAIG